MTLNALLSHHDSIWSAIETINETYDHYQRFLYALKDLPGAYGIEDIYVAQESISGIGDRTNDSIVNLAVIVEAEPGIDLPDARSRVVDALEGYARGLEGERIKYEFTTLEAYRAPSADLKGALSSVRELRDETPPVTKPRGYETLLEALHL